MYKVTFARPRHDYHTYGDFWRLVELAGYPVQYLDEVDWNADQTVIATPKHPEWQSIPTRHSARLIWWSLERNANQTEPWDMANPYVPTCVDEVWVSDHTLAAKYGWKYVFLGGHRAFGRINVLHKRWDYITLMYWAGRRTALVNGLQGLTCADVPGGTWGENRHMRLQASRMMLSAHQDEQPWHEPVRFMLAGCYALPLLSETCQDSGYWVPGVHYAEAPLAELSVKARYLLQDEVCRAQLGAAAWRLVCVERPFKQEVEAAL